MAAAPSRPALPGLLLINGFSRFGASPDFAEGISPRIIARMRTGLRHAPEGMLRTFRQRAGIDTPVPHIACDRLEQGLAALMDMDCRPDLRHAPCPVHVMAGTHDAIAPRPDTGLLSAPWPGSHPMAGCRAPASPDPCGRLCPRHYRPDPTDTPAMTRTARIAARFDAADDYEQAARVQRLAAMELARRIGRQYGREAPARILEVGCGTGLLTRELRRLFPAPISPQPTLPRACWTAWRDRCPVTRICACMSWMGRHRTRRDRLT
ncbi:hypothetical protein RAA17_17140 [Komagataeibacter rhaeticus]|nr:hypothetical protein [Komagataeibacter rhaeticus]